jgi:hypothetical protein
MVVLTYGKIIVIYFMNNGAGLSLIHGSVYAGAVSS